MIEGQRQESGAGFVIGKAIGYRICNHRLDQQGASMSIYKMRSNEKNLSAHHGEIMHDGSRWQTESFGPQVVSGPKGKMIVDERGNEAIPVSQLSCLSKGKGAGIDRIDSPPAYTALVLQAHLQDAMVAVGGVYHIQGQAILA